MGWDEVDGALLPAPHAAAAPVAVAADADDVCKETRYI